MLSSSFARSVGARLGAAAIAARTFHGSSAAWSHKVFVHRDSKDNNDSVPFEFTAENMERAKAIMANYPPSHQRAALIPLLDLAQRQHGWLPLQAMNKVAEILNMPPMRVYEVATFYTMFNREPMGKYFVQVCTTSPCQLRDCQSIVDTCEKVLGIKMGETTADRMFTLGEVECAGACSNAPLFSVNDDYYEDLTPETAQTILEAFKRGEKPRAGPQNGRLAAEPLGGPTTLLTPPPGPGFKVRADL